MVKLKLNNKEVFAKNGQTILEVAEENGINIPTLCHDKELNPFGSCWVCAVEVKGRRGFVTACGTEVLNGMEVTTDSKEIFSARKMALELLLSDHYADCEAPCKIACPNNVDIQSYVALIANGQHHEAVKIIKETLPMPLSIGRVCPAFCEEECRRSIVDEPIAIRQLKRYAADFDLNDDWTFVPDRKPLQNKKIAIIGGGPSGLSCGFFLSNNGYDVDVFESAPKAGGWLRYGIPEYRLPKAILDKEIALMCANGMKIHYNKTIGKDLVLKNICNDYDAVYLAIGASNAVPMWVEGSNIDGVILGVDFLRDLALGKKQDIGKKVAIIGGGNTAVDCARTSKRLGADVTIVYRRTVQEMPAEDFEIEASKEEGIHFYMLTNPVAFIEKNGKLGEIKFEKMELGEPDASGRRRPMPTGEFFTETFDCVIPAISQIPEVEFLKNENNYIDGKELPLSKKATSQADENTMYTGLGNVFAGGDFRRGPATAIEAIADARIAAEMIDRYLNGLPIEPIKSDFDSKKEKNLKDVDPKEYEQYEKIARIKMNELDVNIRNSNFEEVETGFEENEARNEAERCLECGCQKNESCALRQYGTEYDVEVALFSGEKNQHPIDHTHPFILRDENKCIKCGRCVRICTEVQGPGVLGYMYRGFTSIVAPEFGESLTNTTCESCGKCIEVCPVGALSEKNTNYKLNPTTVNTYEQNCGNCGVGCKIKVNAIGKRITKIETPENVGFNDRNLCFNGRFGWQIFDEESRIYTPILKKENIWGDAEWNEIEQELKLQLAKAESKKIYVSADVTNEEILMLKQVAENIGAEIASLSYSNDFTTTIIPQFMAEKSFEEIQIADVIVIVGEISLTLKSLIRAAQRNGKKLIIVNNIDSEFNRFADKLIQIEDLSSILKEIRSNSNEVIGFDLPKKTLFVYNRNDVNEEVALDVWKLAGDICSFAQGSGVLITSERTNFNGLLKYNIKSAKPEKADFVLLYGENISDEIKKGLEDSKFIVSVKTHYEEEHFGNIILPQATYLEIDGSSFTDDGKLTMFKNCNQSDIIDNILNTFTVAGMLSEKHSELYYWIGKVRKLEVNKVLLSIPNKELLTRLEYISSTRSIAQKSNSDKKKRLTKLKLLAKS